MLILSAQSYSLVKVSEDNPYRPWGRKISDPTYYVLYPSSVAQNGLRSRLNSSRSGGFSAPICSLSSHSVFGDHVCQISKKLARVSPVNFDIRETEWTVGVRGDTPETAGAAIARSTEALDEDQTN
eukprot:3351176-Pleurochrysis_carterae.AAC.2